MRFTKRNSGRFDLDQSRPASGGALLTCGDSALTNEKPARVAGARHRRRHLDVNALLVVAVLRLPLGQRASRSNAAADPSRRTCGRISGRSLSIRNPIGGRLLHNFRSPHLANVHRSNDIGPSSDRRKHHRQILFRYQPMPYQHRNVVQLHDQRVHSGQNLECREVSSAVRHWLAVDRGDHRPFGRDGCDCTVGLTGAVIGQYGAAKVGRRISGKQLQSSRLRSAPTLPVKAPTPRLFEIGSQRPWGASIAAARNPPSQTYSAAPPKAITKGSAAPRRFRCAGAGCR